MNKFNRLIVVSVALLALTTLSSLAVSTQPEYGTRGFFKTFSAKTISDDDIPSIGVTLLSVDAPIEDLDYKYDLLMNTRLGVTVTPLRFVEGAFHISGFGHIRQPVDETGEYYGGLGDLNWALKGRFADQTQAGVSLGSMITMDFPLGDDAYDDLNTPENDNRSFKAEGNNNIAIMGLVTRTQSFGGTYGGIEANLNAGYLIRNGNVSRELGDKGQIETISRPNALIGGVGLGINPGTEVVTLIIEATGMLNAAYEEGSLINHKDTNLEVTAGAVFNSNDFLHFGIGGSYKVNNSWGPYSGPDYRVFMTHSMDVGLIAGDRDKDGIRDNKDKCPDDPEDFDAFEDYDGCPDLDNDKDGIPDTEDQCPDDPEDIDGFEDSDGCPDPDNDGDGILDVDDNCPNEAENFNGVDDEDGCPDEKAQPEVTRFTLEGLKFKPNSAELVAGTYASLEKAGEMLREYDDINVLIEGHAASTGRPDFESSLSQERADSVKKYLVGTYGISSGRIRTIGYGSTKPIGDNSNEAGRKMNRRIEFVVE